MAQLAALKVREVRLRVGQQLVDVCALVDPAPDAGEKITLHYLTLDEFIELARNPKFRDLEVSLNIFRAIATKDGYENLKSLFSPE